MTERNSSARELWIPAFCIAAYVSGMSFIALGQAGAAMSCGLIAGFIVGRFSK